MSLKNPFELSPRAFELLAKVHTDIAESGIVLRNGNLSPEQVLGVLVQNWYRAQPDPSWLSPQVGMCTGAGTNHWPASCRPVRGGTKGPSSRADQNRG
jgi:hypothetical protein